MNWRLAAAIASGVASAFIFYSVDMTTLAGAHPQWATQLLLSGTGFGTLLALLTMRYPFRARTMAFCSMAIVAYLMAQYGQMQFAASYAEDALAGRMWYFGWHIVCIAMVAQIISAAAAQLRYQ